MDRGSHVPKTVLTAALGLAVFAACGCGLFKPRDPMPPAAPPAPCSSLTDPDNLVSNILTNYGILGGAGCYNSMVDTAFAFHPDPADSSQNPTSYLDWNQAVEIGVNASIASDARFLDTVFDSVYQAPTTTISPRTETRYYAYHLLFQAKSQADTTRYQGRAEIKFAQGAGSGFWSIVDWRDHSDGSGYFTWGRLRADHRL